MSCPSMDNIDRACSLTDKPNLTADGSRQLLLPTVLGNTNNRDLNNIDCHAMASLINGHFADQVMLAHQMLKYLQVLDANP